MTTEKFAIGKLYEKFAMIKRSSHALDVGMAYDKLTGRMEIILMLISEGEEEGDIRFHPLAKILPTESIQEELEPNFLKSTLISGLFEVYSEHDTERFTVVDFDNKDHPIDPTYEKLVQLWDELSDTLENGSEELARFLAEKLELDE